MSYTEYQILQERFSKKLKNKFPTNKEKSYNKGILACKSILKEIYESQFPKGERVK